MESEKLLLGLLSAALFGRGAPGHMTGAQVAQVLALAQRHQVATLLYPVLRGRDDVADEARCALRVQAMRAALQSQHMMAVQDEVLRLLAGMPRAVVKGSSVAACYPFPELRPSVDIDILVCAQDMPAAIDILGGAQFHHESGHTFHECFAGRGVQIEMHRALSRFPQNPKGKFAMQWLEDALLFIEDIQVMGYTIPAMSQPFQLGSLLAHMHRNLTGGKISLRQLCDWALYVDQCKEPIDESTRKILDDCGLGAFARAVTRACAVGLGMPEQAWAQNVDEQLARKLLEEVMCLNTAGDRDASLILARGQGKGTMLANYIANINCRIRAEHPLWGRCPLILPFFWAYYPARWWLRMRQGKERKVSLGSTLAMAAERKKLFDQLALYQ